MQLGFVIDHSRCIGCHACTVACKSENDVPVGDFRTWVKHTEVGTYPTVKRHFAVLRCNQCSDAPCMTICPTSALDRLGNGIVDVDPALCIGCKSCMQGCPYDALYIHPEQGTAQKCHFCAHRTELGLAPACAIVCPTEAIIPGDFDDPTSLVSRMKAGGGLSARKLEAGTRPNVWYREVDPTGITPSLTSGSSGYLWANRRPGPQLDAEAWEAIERKAGEHSGGGGEPVARTVYDIDRQPMWGWRVSAYLFTKAAAAGAFLVGFPTVMAGDAARTGTLLVTLVALVMLAVTNVLLVTDLKRPERFLLILKHPNWNSWVCKGAVVLTAYGAVLGLWFLLALFDALPSGALRLLLGVPSLIVAGLTAAYTAWLLGQAKGRVLWLQRGLWLRLLLHAGVAGAGALLLLAGPLGLDEGARSLALSGGVLLVVYHVLGFAFDKLGAPRGREPEYERTVKLIHSGPFSKRHRLALLTGLIAAIFLFTGASAAALAFATGLLLVSLYVDGDIFVRAGQALRIS